MKILLINDFLYGGGAEVVFRQMYDSLKVLDYEVDLFYQEEKPKISSSPITYIYNFKIYNRLTKILARSLYTHIIIFNYASALSPSVLMAIKKYKKRTGCKVIYNSHDAHLICPNSGLNYFMRDGMYRFDEYSGAKVFLFKCLDHRGRVYSLLKKFQWLIAYKILKCHKIIDEVISPSNFLGERIKKFYPDMEVKLLRNPCLQEWHNTKESRKYELPINLIFIGRLSNEKGLIPLIKSLSKIDVKFKFDIYGDGPLKTEISNIIKEENLQNKIFLKGTRSHDEIMALLSNYDALILPSLMYENAPMSIVEAASKKLYIITMDYGGMKELAERVGNYAFINPLSPEKLERAFFKVLGTQYKNTNLSEFTYTSYKRNLQKFLLR